MRRSLNAILSFVIAAVIWEVVVDSLKIPKYVLPPPSLILRSLWHGLTAGVATRGLLAKDALYVHIGFTALSTLIGFILGSALGLVLAVLVSESRLLDQLLSPLLSAFQSMPKIALAPLFVIWFGYGELAKVMLATVLVFFPVMINSISGFKNVDPDRVMLARALNASRWRALRHVRLPSALPFIFSGLQVGIVYALLGAVVGEFIAGSLGLGARIVQLQSTMDVPGVFAALVILGIMGALLQALLVWIESKVVFWVRREHLAL